MILAFAMNNPQATADAVKHYNTPGQVDASKLQTSAADFAMQALNCYHKTARFRGVDILGARGPNRASSAQKGPSSCVSISLACRA